MEIEKFILSIEVTEKLTGIGFFVGLDTAFEKKFESRVNFNHWRIEDRLSVVNLKFSGKIKKDEDSFKFG